ncbi:hypothetical protein EDD17DRAFT_1717502 [Pisolithus thermaeus]|nr:hypothetical protein EDD17DRAFT_1717502 [Pisolithus thermaeus]
MKLRFQTKRGVSVSILLRVIGCTAVPCPKRRVTSSEYWQCRVGITTAGTVELLLAGYRGESIVRPRTGPPGIYMSTRWSACLGVHAEFSSSLEEN